MNKIVWTKIIDTCAKNQLEFCMPTGYKVFTSEDIKIVSTNITKVDLGVSIYSEKPITLIYTKTILSHDFNIVDPVQMIGAYQKTPLYINVINPVYSANEDLWVLPSNSYIANMIPIDSSYTNLFEVSNRVFKTYV